MGENQSVVAICDQVLESMDADAVKTLWLKGRAHTALKEYDKAIEAIGHACKVDPNNTEFRTELDRVKKVRATENQKQH